MSFKKKFLFIFFISVFSSACTFEPLYSEKFLAEYKIIEPSKTNKELHEIYRNLSKLISSNSKYVWQIILILTMYPVILFSFIENLIFILLLSISTYIFVFLYIKKNNS